MSSQNRFSRDGFQQLPRSTSPPMGNPNDATIDIPLTSVNTKTGARKTEVNGQQAPSPRQKDNEKAGLFHRGVAGRRKAAKKGTNTADDDRGEDGLNQLGRIYDKILNFSIVTRYFLYVLPLAILIAVPIIVGATVAKETKIGNVRIVWFFTWVEIVWLSIWVSKLAARSLPAVFQFLCGVVSSGTRKYALVLKALEIPLSLSGWALAAMATFIPVISVPICEIMWAVLTKHPTDNDSQPRPAEERQYLHPELGK